MGQRTQLVIEVKRQERNYETNELEIKRYVGSYHNQWGLGTMQLRDIKRFLTTYFNNMQEFEFPKTLYKAYLMEPEDDTPFDAKKKCTPKNVMGWLNHQFNNNGGALLTIDINLCGYITGGRLYIFNNPERDYDQYFKEHPTEENCPENFCKVSRIVSFNEYLCYYPEYFSEAFITGFFAELRENDIKLMEPE